MPIFEYHCRACDTVFETLVHSSSVEVACGACGSRHVDRLLSVFSTSSTQAAKAPCSDGNCPVDGMAGSGCSSGGCPCL